MEPNEPPLDPPLRRLYSDEFIGPATAGVAGASPTPMLKPVVK